MACLIQVYTSCVFLYMQTSTEGSLARGYDIGMTSASRSLDSLSLRPAVLYMRTHYLGQDMFVFDDIFIGGQ